MNASVIRDSSSHLEASVIRDSSSHLEASVIRDSSSHLEASVTRDSSSHLESSTGSTEALKETSPDISKIERAVASVEESEPNGLTSDNVSGVEIVLHKTGSTDDEEVKEDPATETEKMDENENPSSSDGDVVASVHQHTDETSVLPLEDEAKQKDTAKEGTAKKGSANEDTVTEDTVEDTAENEGNAAMLSAETGIASLSEDKDKTKFMSEQTADEQKKEDTFTDSVSSWEKADKGTAFKQINMPVLKTIDAAAVEEENASADDLADELTEDQNAPVFQQDELTEDQNAPVFQQDELTEDQNAPVFQQDELTEDQDAPVFQQDELTEDQNALVFQQTSSEFKGTENVTAKKEAGLVHDQAAQSTLEEAAENRLVTDEKATEVTDEKATELEEIKDQSVSRNKKSEGDESIGEVKERPSEENIMSGTRKVVGEMLETRIDSAISDGTREKLADGVSSTTGPASVEPVPQELKEESINSADTREPVTAEETQNEDSEVLENVQQDLERKGNEIKSSIGDIDIASLNAVRVSDPKDAAARSVVQATHEEESLDDERNGQSATDDIASTDQPAHDPNVQDNSIGNRPTDDQNPTRHGNSEDDQNHDRSNGQPIKHEGRNQSENSAQEDRNADQSTKPTSAVLKDMDESGDNEVVSKVVNDETGDSENTSTHKENDSEKSTSLSSTSEDWQDSTNPNIKADDRTFSSDGPEKDAQGRRSKSRFRKVGTVDAPAAIKESI
ncbi:unnamed protein product, partial [Cyprideis torosa]